MVHPMTCQQLSVQEVFEALCDQSLSNRCGLPYVFSLPNALLVTTPSMPFSLYVISFPPLQYNVQGKDKGGKAVTTAKDQGPHGYCGTFARVAAAEGQYGKKEMWI